MNWMGGSLQRTKRANNGVVQKQKAHFARARTRLQNGPRTPTSPLRLSHFHEEKVSLGGHLQIFSSQSVHHTRQSKPLRERSSRPGSHNYHVPGAGTRKPAQDKPSRQVYAGYRTTTGGTLKAERKVEDADPEERLLNERRMILLQQRDWVGLTRSKPGSIRFTPSEEREEMGKRRKIRDHRALTVPKRHAPKFLPPQLRNHSSRQSGPYMSGVLQNGNDNIMIHIGTDALANLTPTQQTLAQSQTAVTSHGESSDTMLFDNEGLHTTPNPYPEPVPFEDPDPRTFVGALRMSVPLCLRCGVKCFQNHQPSDQEAAATSRKKGTPGAFRGHWTQHKRTPGSPAASVGMDVKDKVSGCYITQQLGGTSHPLRLVVDRTSDFSANVGGREGTQGDVIGEMNHAYKLANARLHENGNKREHAGNALASQTQIDDDGPWRSFLPIPDDSSSRLIATDTSASDKLHYCTTSRTHRARNAGPIPCSQHATTQGGQMCIISSSCVSTSLPSLTRDSEKDALETRSHCKKTGYVNPRKTKQDEEEQLWQTFVFGNKIAAASDLADGGGVGEEEEVEHTMSSRMRIPSHAAALRSLSSTPFKSIPECTSGVSESVQDAAARAPLPTSSGSMLPMIVSPQEMSDNTDDDATQGPLQQGWFGAQSVTHTYIQNNVSCGTDVGPSESSGDPGQEASRNGLDRCEGCRKDSFRPVQARGKQCASIYDIPVSDDDLLDMVGGGSL